MSTTPRFYSDAAPELGPETMKFTVDCKWGTTRIWWTPGELVLPERHVVSVLLQRHEDECGRCRLEKLWERHGDPLMKAEVDRLHSEIGRRMMAKHLAELRN
jgi:hypothetical protein